MFVEIRVPDFSEKYLISRKINDILSAIRRRQGDSNFQPSFSEVASY